MLTSPIITDLSPTHDLVFFRFRSHSLCFSNGKYAGKTVQRFHDQSDQKILVSTIPLWSIENWSKKLVLAMCYPNNMRDLKLEDTIFVQQ